VPGLDPGFAAIIRKAMAREADARYQDAGAFQQAISEWMTGAGLSGTFHHAPPPRAPMQSAADLLATSATEPPPPMVALSNTAASLPGAETTAGGSSGRSKAPLIAGVVVSLALVAGGVLFVEARSTKGAAGPTVANSAPSAVSPPPVASSDPPAATASSGPMASIVAEVPDAGGAQEAPGGHGSSGGAVVANQGGTGKAGVAPIPVMPGPAPSATSAQVKGRTIRTGL
jgi:hypothetical protein